MSDTTSLATGSNREQDRFVETATGVVAGNQNLMEIRKAIECVGMSKDSQCNMKPCQQVKRRATKFAVVEVGKATPLPNAVGVENKASTTSSLMSGSQATQPKFH